MDKKILDQLNVALKSLKAKQATSPEEVVDRYIKKYEYALSESVSASDVEKVKALKSLKGLARSYLESSSDYNQKFLQEMDQLELLLKES